MAFSGGLDSTVLLHRLVVARRALPRTLRLRAVHVNHHLQPAATAFARHCRQMARRWQVPLKVLDVNVPATRGASPEEQARDARYAALGAGLSSGELLLTAQHADDQFETVLLALLRGAGPAGLAGMPEALRFGEGWLLRPLLGETRAGLAAEAREAGLTWVDDPSNPDPRFDRNYLRSELLPVLRARWPGLAATAARSARLCAQAADLARQTARRDLLQAADGGELEAAALRRLAPARAAGALRAWIAERGARVPDERRLIEILRMLEARADAAPFVLWGQWQVSLSQGRLALRAAAPQRLAAAPQAWHWRQQQTLRLADGGYLSLRPDPHGDVDLDAVPESLQVHWHAARRPAPPFAGQRRLRKLFQQLAVPAAGRGALPLLWTCADGGTPPRLLAIADLWVDAALRATAASCNRGRFVWQLPA
ncbi:MAG: tRNA lysidine(34) synthetase TilS [Steroidobacteraceae bacterium]